MKTQLVILRPASLDDLVDSLGTPKDRLASLVRQHRIGAVTRVNGVGFYGPREIRRIFRLAQSS
jgi:hypothetical protein